MCRLLTILLATLASAATPSLRNLPEESPEAAAGRHAAVAARRADTPLLVHRGATKFAPENTLEAYAAAMDRGADGVEIDIRRSSDGVLYVHHDDDLGRTIEGEGKIARLTYDELLRKKFKAYGVADKHTHAPTLAAVLTLARERAMLLHLDIKEPGLDDDIAALLDAADAWDHVVHVNAYHSEKLRQNPRLKPLAYKGWFHEAGKTEKSRAQFLSRPQHMVFVKDDPTEAAAWLGKKPAR